MENNKKKKNILYSTSFIIFGITLYSLGGYFLYNSHNLKEEKNMLTKNNINECKIHAEKHDFNSSDLEKNLIFNKDLDKNQDYMISLLEMQSIFQNCNSLKLKEACIGYSCKASDDKNNELSVFISMEK